MNNQAFKNIILPKKFKAPHLLSGLEPSAPILVGLSGGADSSALLLMLKGYSEQSGAKIYAAHLNHGIRGKEADRDERFCKELGIEDMVCFCGFVEDMAPVYRLLRVNVNCSVGTETSCLALSEGMSASLPMVVSDYGGNGAMVGDGKAGILFPAGDEKALADALEKIVLHEDLEREMKKASYERYLKNYTAVQMTEHLTAVYEDLLL